MASTVSPPTVATLVTRSIVLDATRCWRDARDSRRPVQPALFQALAVHRCGLLTPAIDSLLQLFEKCTGRRFRTGARGQAGLSGDEQQLLDLLAGPERGETVVLDTAASPRLARAMRTALRSARIMLRLALEPGDHIPSSPQLRMLVAV